MKKPLRYRLLDVQSAGQDALRVLEQLDSGHPDNRWLRLAIERLMITVGEAVSQLPPELLKREPTVDWSRVTGIRHVLVHDYDGVDQERVLNAVRHHLPATLDAIERLLAEEL